MVRYPHSDGTNRPTVTGRNNLDCTVIYNLIRTQTRYGEGNSKARTADWLESG